MSTAPSPPSAPPPPARRGLAGCLLPLAVLLLLLSVAVNAFFVLMYTGAVPDPLADGPEDLDERVYLGDRNARDKVAVVRVTGVLTQSSIEYPIRQLRAAAADPRVKAIVIRIDSPGGTVSASDELYQCIVNVRDNNGRRFPGSGPKPVTVSLGPLATSGGYYIAVAGSPIVAERTTITGSIGVFAALPNVAGWTEQHGVKVELVKAGGMKASGSFFHAMGPQERQTWQDVVDQAYDAFLDVIARGRPGLTPDVLTKTLVIDTTIPARDEKGNVIPGAPKVEYKRVRADGGTFTAPQALKFRLIDGIEDLPTAVRNAATRSNLGSYKAVVYERPPTLLGKMFGLEVRQRPALLDLPDVSSNLTPRLWYLAPSADAGLLAPAP